MASASDSTVLAIDPAVSDRVRVAGTPDGRMDVSVRADGGSWLRLHSARAPEGEARQFVDRALSGGEVPAVVGIIGVGLGYVVDELISRRSDVRIIAYEVLPELVPLWQRRSDLTERLSSGQLVVATAPAFETPSVRLPAEALRSDPLVLVHPVLGQHWPSAAATAKHALLQVVFEQRANEEARQRLAPLYLSHTLQNFPGVASAPDVRALDGIASGEPLVVCGAGPSLDRLLPTLRENRHRAWYVALDTSLRPLLAAGIVPDLVVSIDPTWLNGRHLLDLPTRKRPWLVAEGSAHPQVWAAYRGRSFATRINRSDPWPWLESLGVAPTVLRAWGSVLTTACDLITRMRPATVAFAAVDLAYTDGQLYCRGTAFEGDWEAERVNEGLASVEALWALRLRDRTIQEPDVNGRVTQTAGHLVAFRNWARTLVANTPSCRFANVTGAGILHGEAIAQTGLAQWLDASRAVDGDREARVRARADQARPAHSPMLASALDAASGSDAEPCAGWEARVPRTDRRELTRLLQHAARQMRAFNGANEMSVTESDWIDVPHDPAAFSALPPMQWQVEEKCVDSFAYRIDGKTMWLSFKINYSTLAGQPTNELHLKIPGGHRAARGTAGTIWIGSLAGKEVGYATTHPGLDVIVLFRATEARYPIEHEWFFVFGQMMLEIQ